jgi:hypothetical protein
MNISNSDLFSFLSLIVALLALLYTYFSNTKKYELISQYRSELLSWFKCTNELLIRLKIELKSQFPNPDLKRELLSQLSSQIEIGRFYFPNINKQNGFGNDKPIAYRGYRCVILDFLVYSYRIFDRENSSLYLAHAEVLQRHFTSSVFELINPRDFLSRTRKLTNRHFSNDLIFEDFLEEKPELIDTYILD